MAACVVSSETPLSEPGAAPADARLDGVWVTRNERGAMYAHIGGIGEGWLGIVLVQNDRDGEGAHVAYYRGFRSVLDGTDFLNAKAVVAFDGDGEVERPDEGEKDFILVRYRISADGKRLETWMLEDVFAEDAVETGKIAGRASGSDVVLTDSRENLAAFLAAAPAEAFDELWTFERVAD